MTEQFPGITRAALAMTYDNGGINRDRSEAEMLADLKSFLSKCIDANHSGIRTALFSSLRTIDAWLNGLAEEALETVCNGEESEAKAAITTAPEGTTCILNGIFDEVV